MDGIEEKFFYHIPIGRVIIKDWTPNDKDILDENLNPYNIGDFIFDPSEHEMYMLTSITDKAHWRPIKYFITTQDKRIKIMDGIEEFKKHWANGCNYGKAEYDDTCKDCDCQEE